MIVPNSAKVGHCRVYLNHLDFNRGGFFCARILLIRCCHDLCLQCTEKWLCWVWAIRMIFRRIRKACSGQTEIVCFVIKTNENEASGCFWWRALEIFWWIKQAGSLNAPFIIGAWIFVAVTEDWEIADCSECWCDVVSGLQSWNWIWPWFWDRLRWLTEFWAPRAQPGKRRPFHDEWIGDFVFRSWIFQTVGANAGKHHWLHRFCPIIHCMDWIHRLPVHSDAVVWLRSWFLCCTGNAVDTNFARNLCSCLRRFPECSAERNRTDLFRQFGNG